MKQIKTSLWVVTVSSILITLIIYHLYKSPYAISFMTRFQQSSKVAKVLPKEDDEYQPVPMNHIPLDELYKSENESDYSMEEDNANPHILWTPGCKIPFMTVSYKKIPPMAETDMCGKRLVFLSRIDSNNIRVSINEDALKKDTNYQNYECCLRFYMNEDNKNEDIDVFSSCNKCENGDTFMLQSDFVNVQCFGYDNKNDSHVIYDDYYAFCKKKIQKRKKCDTQFNILMLGMDSMSLPRFAQTMTETLNFMKNNFWLSYRGYHKVDDNTFPNLIATLTGLNFKVFSDRCLGRMDYCNGLLSWSSFSSLGYVTAYGEDYVSLPDTFSKNYTLTTKPTDHYMRPLFKMAEKTKYSMGMPYLCSGEVTSGQQLLDFAYDFVMTYRDEPFFGLFRMNSFSHDPFNHPRAVDKIYENFLNRLFYTGVLKNTFIIFFSEHGIRFGRDRFNVEGYYDDHMPLLFILPPTLFKSKYPEKYKSMIVNQFRLVTPYDVKKTMLEIYKISECRPKSNTKYYTKKFNNHESLFNIIPGNRTCQDVLIDDNLCSCHNLYPYFPLISAKTLNMAEFVINHMRNKTDKIVPKPCTRCVAIRLQGIKRVHFYYDDEKVNVFFVVAFETMPGNMVYEAKVLCRGDEMELVGSINTIWGTKGLGWCATNNYEDNNFCVCDNDC